jgi:acetyl esterase/lipase
MLERGEPEFWEAARLLQKRYRGAIFPKALDPTAMDVGGYPLTRLRGGARRGVTETDKACLYIHGGGFVEPPSLLHRQAIARWARDTGATVYAAQYPLLPDADITQILAHIREVYSVAADDFGRPLTAVFGDSAGGTLALYLASVLEAAEQPGRFIALSPCCDSGLTNPEIRNLEAKDPILSVRVLRVLAKMLLKFAANNDISPLYLPYENLRRSGAKLDLFIGGAEILYPDNVRMHERLTAEGIEHGWNVEPKLFHIYPLAPFIPECTKAFAQICEMIKNT